MTAVRSASVVSALTANPYRNLTESVRAYHVAPCASTRSGFLPDYENGWPFEWGPSEEQPNDTVYRCVLCGDEMHLFRDVGDRDVDRGPRVLRDDVLITATRNRWFPPVVSAPPTIQLCDGTSIDSQRWFGTMERVIKNRVNLGLSEREARLLVEFVRENRDKPRWTWRVKSWTARRAYR